MKSLFSPVDARRSEGGATHQELDRLLAHLKIPPVQGLEARILTRLEAQSASEAFRKPSVSSHGWAPAAIAASLVCVFAGGALVARQTSAATRFAHESRTTTGWVQQPLPQAATGSLHGKPGVTTAALPTLGSMDTAAARRKPATQILVGRHRGRATTSAGTR